MLVQGSRFKGAGLSPSSTASGIRDVRCSGHKTKAIDHLEVPRAKASGLS
jgi:hypothetical protein